MLTLLEIKKINNIIGIDTININDIYCSTFFSFLQNIDKSNKFNNDNIVPGIEKNKIGIANSCFSIVLVLNKYMQNHPIDITIQ